jgi:hypothetical protein
MNLIVPLKSDNTHRLSCVFYNIRGFRAHEIKYRYSLIILNSADFGFGDSDQF